MKKLLIFVLSVFTYSYVYAGQFTIADFRGENAEENALLIEPSKSPNMDNMDPSRAGSTLERRLGQTFKFNVTYSTWSVKSFGIVKNNSYSRLIVGYGPHVEAIDTAWSSASMIHSSATVGYVWDFASFQGYVYATNGVDTPFYTDGDTKTFLPSATKTGTSVVFFNDTMWIANWPADHAGVGYSKYSDPTNWTTGIGPTDARFFSVADFGEKVVDLEILGNSVLILCSKSIMKAVGYENPYQIVEVDKSVGCKSKGSVVTHLGWTYFLGSDGQYYKTDGTIVEDISSDEFFTAFDNTALSQRTANFSTLTTESEFATGITSHTSTSEISGSVALPTGSTTYTSASDWNAWTLTNIDSTTVAGSLLMKNYGFFDAFDDEDYTSDPTWTIISGTFYSGTDFLFNSSSDASIRTPLDSSLVGTSEITLTFRWRSLGSPAPGTLTVYVYTNAANTVYFKLLWDGTAKTVKIVTPNGSSSTSSAKLYPPDYEVHYYTAIQEDGDTYKLYSNGVLILTFNDSGSQTIPTTPYVQVEWDNGFMPIDDFGTYAISGQSISPIIDTEINGAFNLVWGIIDWTDTTVTSETHRIYVRTSTDSAMGDNPAYAEQTDETQITEAVKRYIQIKSTMTALGLSTSPKMDDVTLGWATTGYYITPEIVIADINSWGVFEVSESGIDDSNVSITYFTYSSNTVVSDDYLKDTASWTSQTKNTTIGVSTNTYVWGKAVYSITVATQVPTTDSITFNWISGSDTTEDMTAYWDAERLYLGVIKTADSSTNDGVFVFDPDLDAWWQYKNGVYPSAFTSWNNTFLVASSTSGAVYSFLDGDTDNGTNIDCSYTSKYLTGVGGISPYTSDLLYYTMVYSSQTTGSFVTDWYLNGNTTSALSLTYDMTLGNAIVMDTIRFPSSFNAKYWQFKISNVDGGLLEFHGLLGQTIELPFKFKVVQ